ncbi:MAG: hypothetical protein AAB404_02650, partial [Patescibacteria group bacterium]
MNKKLFFSISIVFVLSVIFFPRGFAAAATYYMAATGSNSNTGAEAAPWLTLQYSMARMAGGDTLIIENGTYTGYANTITNTANPPEGFAGNYTIIKARNDGEVFFDGQDTYNTFMAYMFTTADRYWQFEGIIWGRSIGPAVYFSHSRYVKFLRCGVYDGADGNNSGFVVGEGSDYVLVENCYSWGSGRYKFEAYQSDHVIFRQVVGRLDQGNFGGEPIGGIAVYSSDDVEVQNSIVIDSDQDASWSNESYRSGSFLSPSTDMDSNRVVFDRCIGLNTKLGGFNTSGNSWYQSRNVVFKDCVMWDYGSFAGMRPNYLRANDSQILNSTFGSSSIGSPSHYGGGTGDVMKNSLIYGHTQAQVVGGLIATQNYNSYYGNRFNNNSGVNDITNINPIYNASTNPTGALKYITRIESGSNLAGRGENGADIGANLKTLIGTPGTLWGEPGYNTDTGVSMWPFPNEDLIKSKMKAYSGGGVSGNRGFAADGNG